MAWFINIPWAAVMSLLRWPWGATHHGSVKKELRVHSSLWPPIKIELCLHCMYRHLLNAVYVRPSPAQKIGTHNQGTYINMVGRAQCRRPC